ncbi:MAG: hypothetical protein R3212_13635 [Xanthomonadales bacterium]|nr:hypothetical protein [Xanthomonadales bacterium]
MSNTILKTLTISAFCACIAVTGSAFAAAGTHKIAGIWEFAGEPDGTCGAPPFVNYTTISNDGTMINLDPTEGTSAGRIHWVPGGGYVARFFGYIANTGGLQFEVVGSLSLADQDTLMGSYTVDLSAPDGTLLCAWGGNITGTRID